MMKLSFTALASWALLLCLAKAQTCQVAMGVASSNTGCNEAIINEIALYMQIVHRDECGLPGDSRRNLAASEEEEDSTKKLRGNTETEDRELQSQQQCDTWQYFCTIGYNPQYYCQAYYSCLRRDLHEGRALSEPTENPLTDPGWKTCDLDFAAFLQHVDTNFMATYATEDIRTCWSYMWCRTK